MYNTYTISSPLTERRDPSMREAIAAHPNARVTEAAHGAGVYEAVLSTLMGSG